MLIRRHDAARDELEWRAFLAAHPFGHLVAGGVNRAFPVIAPTQFVLRDEDFLVHFAGDNPIWDAVAESPNIVLSVAGDWTFIPSAWKALPGEDPRLGIPTTYYGAAQLFGSVRTVDEPEEMAALLRVQLAALQPDVDVADPLIAHPNRLRLIRGMVVSITDVKAKFKFGGNVDQAHRSAVADLLAERGAPGDAAARNHLLRRREGDG